MNARAFGSQSFHDHRPAAAAPKPQPKPDTITVDQWDYELGRFVERTYPNPEVHPLRCDECKCVVRTTEAKNYVGPIAGDGFRRTAIVCATCFEVLP